MWSVVTLGGSESSQNPDFSGFISLCCFQTETKCYCSLWNVDFQNASKNGLFVVFDVFSLTRCSCWSSDLILYLRRLRTERMLLTCLLFLCFMKCWETKTACKDNLDSHCLPPWIVYKENVSQITSHILTKLLLDLHLQLITNLESTWFNMAATTNQYMKLKLSITHSVLQILS